MTIEERYAAHLPPEPDGDGVPICSVCGEYTLPERGSCRDCGAIWGEFARLNDIGEGSAPAGDAT